MKNYFTILIAVFVLCSCAGTKLAALPQETKNASIKSRVAAFNAQWKKIARGIREKEKILGLASTVETQHCCVSTSGTQFAKLEHADGVSGFTSENIRSLFDDTSDTIRRRSLFKINGHEASFLSTLDHENQTFQQAVKKIDGRDFKVYWRDEDVFAYTSTLPGSGQVGLKEWIFIAHPNRAWGSEYVWDFGTDDEGYVVRLAKTPEGLIEVYRQVEGDRGSGIAITDPRPLTPDPRPPKRQSPMALLSDAMRPDPFKNTTQPFAVLEAPIYWITSTLPGSVEVRTGALSFEGNQLILSIREPAEAYPLLVDPTLSYGQWLSPTTGGEASVQALSLDPASADEIYMGGWSSGGKWSESVTFQGASEGSEGFVVEIVDGASPTLNWGQWLGGNTADTVYALAVTADEIYAGGYSLQSTGWESVTIQGAHSGSYETFVVEIADGASPTLNWGQWLGGTDIDLAYAVALTADEIYAGGYSTTSTNWESVAFQGANINQESFVVEIADGGSPTLNWGQWLGGTGADLVQALVVTGENCNHKCDKINKKAP